MERPRFANVLLSGPCNLRCVDCIGKLASLRHLPCNLDAFPLKNMGEFASRVRGGGVREISLTGTNTDPQLHSREEEVVAALREDVPGARISLHTNGVAAPSKMRAFNAYDRAVVSMASFRPETCRAMTGSDRCPDLPAILGRATIPVKVSVLVSAANVAELPSMVARCWDLGVRRMVLRERYGAVETFQPPPGVERAGAFGGNPVYRWGGMEVTVWSFGAARVSCINLFSDGTITSNYLLDHNCSTLQPVSDIVGEALKKRLGPE